MAGSKDSGKENSLEHGEEKNETRSFDSEQLTSVWKDFAKNIDAPQLKAALSQRIPVLKENWVIEYSLDNELQMQRITHELKPKLLGNLRRKLRNSLIQVEFKIAPITDSALNKPYSDTEKWEAMVKKNPALALFKQKFGLDFDSSIN